MSDPSALLSTVFGFDRFRPGQEEIVEAVIAGENVLAIMPTGGGKSLCFQLPALCREGVTVVISPLIALMRDQVRALREATRKRRPTPSGAGWRREASSCFTWRRSGWPRAARNGCSSGRV